MSNSNLPPLVMLRADWPGNFRRVIRDDKGNATGDVVTFHPGQPVQLTALVFAYIACEIGNALLLVDVDDKQRVRPHSPHSGDVPAAADGDVDDAKPKRKRPREPETPPDTSESDTDETEGAEGEADADAGDEPATLQIVSSQTKAAKALELSRNEFRELLDKPDFPHLPEGTKGYNVTAIRAWMPHHGEPHSGNVPAAADMT